MVKSVLVQDYFDSYCYFFIDEATKHGFLIDPGAEPEKLLEIIRQEGWVIEKILLTHGHIDHIGAVSVIRAELNLPVYAHPETLSFIMDEEVNLSDVYGEPPDIGEVLPLSDGGVFQLEADPSFRLKTIFTPGHTVDSVVFYAEREQVAFVGDSIYKGCLGDYLYPGGNYELLLRTVKRKILALPEETVLYSGHSEPTTVGDEKPLYA
ncbi:MAG: MBL fold metallo-hydrolase [Firmicutes bacterium]|nr:MBL fold metallo-hydrolase [Bacillota bacterium]